MHRFALYFSLCTGFACAASAFAGVGATSAGVTTVDPNNPSTDVQQQSSGFVAANQQAQNAANGGIVLPNGVAGTAQAGQNAAGNAGANAAQAGQSGGSNAATEHAPPTVPPPPPPPPPNYESRMRPVGPATVVAPTPAPPAAAAAPTQKPVSAPEKPAQPAPKPAVVPAPNANRAPPVEKKRDEPAPAVTADPGGGRGEAPDGYTFWLGLLIAGALLALAAVTWLRIQRGETLG
ncbi:MAG TPA: hypothetical protein VL425_10850 [Rudaea sp.]|nr:hypothetical protein [Rudaea sp.]